MCIRDSPYSAYMSPESFIEMETETSGKFGGLGIEVGMEFGVVKVITPMDGSPAEREGVKAGDYIVKINETQVQGKTLLEAVELMRGPVGSSLEITVRRKGVKKALVFEIVREIIEVKSVKSKTKFKTLDDFVNRKVGAVAGMAAERDLINRAIEGVVIEITSTFPELYDNFEAGKLDAIAEAEYYTLSGEVIPSHDSSVVLIDHHDLIPGQREESVFVVSNNSSNLLQAINLFIHETEFPISD